VVLVLGPEAVAGVFAGTEPASLVLPAAHAVAFAPPEAVDALAVHAEALGHQEVVDPAIAVARLLTYELLDAGQQTRLVVRHAGLIAEAGAADADETAGPTLGEGELPLDMAHGAPLPGRA
jgi:hypothetical protein